MPYEWKEKAIFFAKELNIQDFAAPNGWLERWKSRNNIPFKIMAGEANSCTSEMTASWKEKVLPTILSKYRLKDIYNADEFRLSINPSLIKRSILRLKSVSEENSAK